MESLVEDRPSNSLAFPVFVVLHNCCVSSVLLRCSVCFGANVGYLFMSVTDDVQ